MYAYVADLHWALTKDSRVCLGGSRHLLSNGLDFSLNTSEKYTASIMPPGVLVVLHCWGGRCGLHSSPLPGTQFSRILGMSRVGPLKWLEVGCLLCGFRKGTGGPEWFPVPAFCLGTEGQGHSLLWRKCYISKETARETLCISLFSWVSCYLKVFVVLLLCLFSSRVLFLKRIHCCR